MSERNTDECKMKCGTLPECAPLAAAYIPVQQDNNPHYSAGDALTRGTLFPGLDLPFLNTVNKSNPYAGTPLGELMALDFVIKELNLYLDTHPGDEEAFLMLKKMLTLYEDGKAAYVKRFGPVRVDCLKYSDSFTWVNGPWPWEYAENTGV